MSRCHFIYHPNFLQANELTSANRLAEFVAYLRDSVWPPTDPTQPTTQPGERAHETKMRTRVLCRTMLLGSVSGECILVYGSHRIPLSYVLFPVTVIRRC